MVYFVSMLIAAFLAVLETSFLPHFRVLGAVPFLLLAFIVALSLKHKGYFFLVIAFFGGIYFDYISNSFPYTFLVIFLAAALVGRFVFYRETSYDIMPVYLSILASAAGLVYLAQIDVLVKLGFVGWQRYILTSFFGILITVFAGYLLFRVLGKYFDWLNKETAERFRG